MSLKNDFSHGGWRPSADRFLEIVDQPLFRTLVDLQDLVTTRTTSFWSERGVKSVHLPITTNSISSPMGLGSDSLPVEIDLFGERTFLADSMQFMLEYGCRLSRNGAWYLMPSFRGEDADESHLNQFFHSEAELPGGLENCMDVVDAYVRSLAAGVMENLSEEIRELAGSTSHIEQMLALDTFPRLTFDEAAAHLGNDPYAVEQHDGWRTLTRHGERRLMQEISPVLWVTHFDHLSVPFYQAYGDAEQRTALNGDLLFGIGETVGCGERHVDGAQTRAALAHHNVPEESYDWYVRMKEGAPMHTSGFGLGVERWFMWVLNHKDIRELQLAPRLNGVALTP
ncbi:asparaginase [Streptomyces sp. PCS3-D2]|uniref:amino acid--tRNA ligase-related protein n=1 Tax=Streptomyces sp. PCS3-D2 TaxID=1460244 RepID=UPI0009962328|nr:amino acid--tRNA ligase-related protein [Streptomyces sp. PCS3-D2]WKV72873.1 asparaginase [Streptomyces sp. PCS3-D2]